MKRKKVVKRLEGMSRNMSQFGQVAIDAGYPDVAEGYIDAAWIIREEARKIRGKK